MTAFMLVFALGCNKGTLVPGDTDDTDADTGDTDTGPTSDEQMSQLFLAVHASGTWVESVEGWVDVDPACPTVSQVDDIDWRIDGGCTAGDVTYDGGIDWLDGPQGQRVFFDGFRVTTPTSDLVYDGEIVVYNRDEHAGVSEADYTVRDPDDTLVYAYDGMQTSLLVDFWDVWDGFGAGTFGITGHLTAAGFGIFAVSETVDNGGSCSQEPDEGQLTLSGPDDIVFTFNGGAICDGCVPFQMNSDPPGEVCPW
jgi:hypothetical protein